MLDSLFIPPESELFSGKVPLEPLTDVDPPESELLLDDDPVSELFPDVVSPESVSLPDIDPDESDAPELELLPDAELLEAVLELDPPEPVLLSELGPLESVTDVELLESVPPLEDDSPEDDSPEDDPPEDDPPEEVPPDDDPPESWLFSDPPWSVGNPGNVTSEADNVSVVVGLHVVVVVVVVVCPNTSSQFSA